MERDVRIALKIAKYLHGRSNPRPANPPLHQSLTTLFNSVRAVSDTVATFLPDEVEVGPEVRRFFLNDWNQEQHGRWSFKVCSYIPGLQAKFMKELDLSGGSVPLSNQTVTDRNGQRLDLVTVFNVVAYGEAVIVEIRKGTGGTHVLAQLLNILFKKFVSETHPRIRLENAVSSDLREEIEQGGGAIGINMRIQEPNTEDGDVYRVQLSELKHHFTNAKDLRLSWTARTTFSHNEIEAAYDDAVEQEDIESLSIKLANNSSITLGDYKISKLLNNYNVDGSGTPDSAELIGDMLIYMRDLMRRQDGRAYLNRDGTLASKLVRRS